MSEHFDTIVIGGGMAGVSAAAALASFGSLLVIEQEASLGAHASGRNAAIFRPLEHDHTTAELARRSLEILSSFTSEAILRPVGLLLASADHARLAVTAAHALQREVTHSVVDRTQCVARVPMLAGGEVTGGVWLPDAGVLDIHRMLTLLAARARDRGARIRYRATVAGLELEAGAIKAVRLADGDVVRCSRVVIAAGAWAAKLGAACGSSVTLTPIRRHLAQLRGAAPHDPNAPVLWRIDPEQELYFRPESGGTLASACDAVAADPSGLATDPVALELLASKLSRTAPTLARTSVQHAWACLRTFAADRELVVGPDAQVPGLYWLAGLGGRGMAVAVAAGEVLGTLIAEEMSDAARRSLDRTNEGRGRWPSALVAALSPGRMSGSSRSMLDN